MHDFLVSTVAFIVLVGVMVVVHEFGHFIVAKLCGVRVEAFSVGFGPRLFGVKYGETDYKVCLLPLGGFVKMTGETPDQISGSGDETLAQNPAADPGAFTSHPRWQRMLIGLAGPAANFVLAFVLMFFYFGWINEVPNLKPSTVEWVTPGSVADQAGLRPGDVIAQFGSASNPDLATVIDLARKDANQTVPISVLRNGQNVQLSLRLLANSSGAGPDFTETGLFLHYEPGPITVDQTTPGTPAERAGLQSGDRILAVDGHQFHTLDPLVAYLQSGQGKPITLTVQRNGATLSPMVITPAKQDSKWHLGFAALPPTGPPLTEQPMALSQAVETSRDFCAQSSIMISQVVGKLFTHKASITQLSGPIGIARIAGQAATTKHWYEKFALAAGISLNLGILNLLPFPILDGGLILLLMIESALRHDINLVVKERIYQAAFVLLLIFFVVVSFNDLTRLPIFSHFR